MDPVTAKEVVLSEEPSFSEETDLIEPTLQDELLCHTGSLASVYHMPPNAFVEGTHLPIHQGSAVAGDSPVGITTVTNMEQPQLMPSRADLLGDLLNPDLSPPVNVPQVSSMQVGAVGLLGGLDSLEGQAFISSSVPATFTPSGQWSEWPM